MANDAEDLIAKTLEEETRRADHARRILTDPLVIEAFDTIETGLREKFFETGKGDQEKRETIWQMNQFLVEFRRFFTSTIESGHMAALELEHRKRRKQAVNLER